MQKNTTKNCAYSTKHNFCGENTDIKKRKRIGKNELPQKFAQKNGKTEWKICTKIRFLGCLILRCSKYNLPQEKFEIPRCNNDDFEQKTKNQESGNICVF